MPRRTADAMIHKHTRSYLNLLDKLGDEQASQQVQVPKMLGVDEDMRGWSVFEIIEHNTIVNRALTSRIKFLMTGEETPEFQNFDVKRDVMPGLGEHPFGRAEISQFTQSVDDHMETVSGYGDMKNSAIGKHPVFGNFTAHQFHVMFGFHLGLHLKQAQKVVELVMER